MASTVYDINVRYMLDDKASRAMGKIGKEAEKASRGTMGLSKSLRRLAVGAAGFLSFRLGKKLLIDYNSQIQQAKIQMGGLLSLNMGGDWARNQKRANFLVKRFQKDAAASVGTTKDFVDMGSLLTGPLSRAGASMEDIGDVTKGAVIASRAFGIEAEVAARDIEQALAGTLGQKDRFARALLEPMGITTKEWNKMVRETPGKAAAMLKSAFEQPAIAKMAEEQKNSWAGVTSTLEDNLQRAFAKVGLPLMKRLTQEIGNITKWFDENPEKVNAIAEKLANGLVSAFEMAKSVFGFIVRHKDLLMTIAKAALIFKVAGGITRGLQGFAGIFNLNAVAQTASQGLTGFAGKLTGTIAKMGRVAGILGGIAIGAQAIADHVLKKQKERIKRRTDNPLLKEQGRLLGGARAGRGTGIQFNTAFGAEKEAKRLGFVGDAGAAGAARADGKGQIRLNDVIRRQQTMAAGKATAGDKLMAERVAKAAKESGFIGKKNRVNVNKIAGAFGAGRDEDNGFSGIMARKGLDRARKMASRGATPGELANALMETNKEAQSAELGNMIQFLRGLERANAINRSDIGKAIMSTFMAGVATINESVKNAAEKDDVSKDKKKGKVVGSRNTNVRISKIEVVSDDPDRFAHNLVGAFNDQTVSPSQARRAIQER